MIVLNIAGGLGNQMFEFALHKTLVMQGRDVVVDLTQHMESNIGIFNLKYNVAEDITIHSMREESLKRDIFTRLKRRFFPIMCKYHYEKGSGIFDEIIFKMDDVYLDGYWQSEKYFKHIEQEIRTMYRFPKLQNTYQIKMCEQIESKISVGVHVRRGDYLNHPEIYGNTDLKYYEGAMKYIQERVENVHFFLFSNDVPWVKENIAGKGNITYIDGAYPDLMTENLDMALMSKCKHNIIANSSFSWWAAWLNSNKDKIIVAPKVWEVNTPTPDIWCEKWVKM